MSTKGKIWNLIIVGILSVLSVAGLAILIIISTSIRLRADQSVAELQKLNEELVVVNTGLEQIETEVAGVEKENTVEDVSSEAASGKEQKKKKSAGDNVAEDQKTEGEQQQKTEEEQLQKTEEEQLQKTEEEQQQKTEEEQQQKTEEEQQQETENGLTDSEAEGKQQEETANEEAGAGKSE